MVPTTVEETENKSPEPSERRSAKSVKKEKKAAFTASVTTAKTTQVHTASFEQRDRAYEVCNIRDLILGDDALLYMAY